MARRSTIAKTIFGLLCPLILLGTAIFLSQWFWYQIALAALTVVVFYFGGLNDRAKRQQQNLPRAAKIKPIDKMSGPEFEHHLAEYFSEQGYKIELTPTSGDYGADIVLRSKNECIVVQAKRWNSKVGISAVQEISTARHYYGASSALLITNSSLTKSAKELARRANVSVWERERLLEKLSESAV